MKKLFLFLVLTLTFISLVSAGSGVGGTVTTSGAYTIHTFTSNGTFNWTGSGTNITFLMVGAGGAGGNDGAGSGGGGGAGGYIFNLSANITAGAYTVTIGSPRANNSGTNTSFNYTTLQASGGGRGGYYTASDAGAGGSGGGGGQTGAGGAGLAGGNISGQGYKGGGGGGQTGGGGGACNPGVDGSGSAGSGGNGCYNAINGTNFTYAGGGAGKGNSGGGNGNGGTGGGANIGSAGATNTGGGGAGGGEGTNNTVGGSGIVIIRYLTNNEGLSVHMVSPVNNTNTSTTNNTFTIKVINDTTAFSVTNVSLLINGTINQTNTSQMNGTYTFTVPLAVAGWNWTAIAFGNDSVQYNATNGTFNLNVKKLVFGNQSYDNSTLEQASSVFRINFSLNDAYAISSTNLTYNQTNYSASFTAVNSTYYQATYTLTTPSVNVNTVVLFNWSVFLTDGTTQTSSTTNQTVFNFGVDDCTSGTVMIYNFTIKNEATQVNLTNNTDNTSIKLDIDFYPNASLSVPTFEFSRDYNQTHPARVCLSSALGSTIFYVNAQVQYGADSYEREFYNIQNYSLNSTSNPSQNISLYDLLTSQSTTYTIIYKDASFLPVKDALVQIQRKYIDEGAFKVVEAPLTDTQGQAVAHLVSDTVIYSFTIVKNGEVLAMFSNVYAQCQNPTINNCEITLNSFSSSLQATDFENSADFSYTLTWDNITRTVSSTFTIPSGAVSNITLVTYKNDALGTELCSTSVTTSAGTLNCVIGSSFGNSTVIAKIFRDGELIAQGSIVLDGNPYNTYGASMVFIGIFMILTLIGAGLSDNPVYTLVFLFVGVVLVFALNLVANNGFLGAGASILWLFLAILIVIIKGARRN